MMNVIGIVMVRNEADVIRLSILHHLSMGLEAVLVIDNGSTDGTARILEQMGQEDPRIQWRIDPGPYKQSDALTALAREGFRQGAEWIVPFDADEFWWVRGGDLLARLGDATAGALRAEVVNFVQDRNQRVSTEDALLSMTRRAPEVFFVGQESIEARQFAYVETRRQPKWLFRPTAEVVVEPGNHAVLAVAGVAAETTGLECLHAPLRSQACLERKADHGERALQNGSPPTHSWHLKRWARLRATGELDQEWAANSYEGTSLDVYGNEKQLTEDIRLWNIVAPLLSHRPNRSERMSDAPKSMAPRDSQTQSRTHGEGRAGQSTHETPPISVAGAAPAPMPSRQPRSRSLMRAHDDPWRPKHLAVKAAKESTITFLRSTDCRVIAEIGIYEGHTSREIVEYLDGDGALHLFDFADYVDAVVMELNQAGYHNVVGYGNSRKLLDSYNWSLMRILQQHRTPIYDYVFLDGGHVWTLDALAFLLLDRLLKPGGYIDFDDYYWSLAISPALNPVDFPKTAELYTDEQIKERQVKLVVDLLVRRDSRYEEVVKNKIFRKLPSATVQPEKPISVAG